MEFTIERAELSRLLKHAVRAVESRNTIAILSMVKLAAADKLTVTATDLDVIATATGAAEVATPGAICVEAKLLADIANKAGAELVNVKLDGDMLIVKAGRSRFKLQTLPASDFPDGGKADYDAEFECDLAALFGAVDFAISNEETRYYLNGVYLTGAEAGLIAVATDGHRIAEITDDGDCL